MKKITKAIWGRNYSATTVSRCNQVLKEDYLKWMNRPISQSIRYLFLDAVNLKIRRHWISKEALLCAIGITEDGKKEFLGFMLGGRESTASWESLLLLLLQRGLSVDHLKMVTVDGNAGLLSALASLLPGVTIQRCIVHKIRNIVGKCPRSLRGVVPAEAKLIFYATSQAEARERFNEFKAYLQLVGITHRKTRFYYHQSNGKIERFYQTCKNESIRKNSFLSFNDLNRQLAIYIENYNYKRLHSSIGYIAPWDMIQGNQEKIFAERKQKLKLATENRIKLRKKEKQNQLASVTSG